MFASRRLLGQPTVDNHDHFGIPVAAEGPDASYPSDGRGYPTAAAQIVGWSKDCASPTRVGYVYKSTAGQFLWLDDPADLPADVATTTTLDGQTAPYVVRRERGMINRFIYSVAMLAPADEVDASRPDDSLWNGRLVFSFQGGVAIGHTQGTTSAEAMLFEPVLSQGYAVVNSTGLRTNTQLQPPARISPCAGAPEPIAVVATHESALPTGRRGDLSSAGATCCDSPAVSWHD